jgi:hypothetical protein
MERSIQKKYVLFHISFIYSFLLKLYSVTLFNVLLDGNFGNVFRYYDVQIQ